MSYRASISNAFRKNSRLQKLMNLHVDCELNYLRLNRLLPFMQHGLKIGQCRKLEAEKNTLMTLSIAIKSVQRFTADIEITVDMSHAFLSDSIVPPIKTVSPSLTKLGLGAFKMHLRLYLDAKMVEIIHINEKRIHWLNYADNNSQQFASSEKNQVNQFLGQWLEHFLEHGQVCETEVFG